MQAHLIYFLKAPRVALPSDIITKTPSQLVNWAAIGGGVGAAVALLLLLLVLALLLVRCRRKAPGQAAARRRLSASKGAHVAVSCLLFSSNAVELIETHCMIIILPQNLFVIFALTSAFSM